jgi:hypothetical protein
MPCKSDLTNQTSLSLPHLLSSRFSAADCVGQADAVEGVAGEGEVWFLGE